MHGSFFTTHCAEQLTEYEVILYMLSDYTYVFGIILSHLMEVFDVELLNVFLIWKTDLQTLAFLENVVLTMLTRRILHLNKRKIH